MLALLLWVLAIYGLFEALSRIIRLIYPHSTADHRMTLVLIVHNGEAYIEGILRMIGYKTSMSRKDVRVILIDAGSTDATCDIVNRIQERDERITLLHAEIGNNLGAVQQIWSQSGLRSPLFLCDLRQWHNQKKIIPYLTRILG